MKDSGCCALGNPAPQPVMEVLMNSFTLIGLICLLLAVVRVVFLGLIPVSRIGDPFTAILKRAQQRGIDQQTALEQYLQAVLYYAACGKCSIYQAHKDVQALWKHFPEAPQVCTILGGCCE